MADFKISRRQFIQGSAVLAAFGALPVSAASAASQSSSPQNTAPDGYLARPLASDNHHSVIMLPESAGHSDQARSAADRLAREGFTAFVPTLAARNLQSVLTIIQASAAYLHESVPTVHIIGLFDSGNLAVIAANRDKTLDRVVVLGGGSSGKSSSLYAFEAPNRTNTLYLTMNAGSAEQTWARVARWLSNSGKAN